MLTRHRARYIATAAHQLPQQQAIRLRDSAHVHCRYGPVTRSLPMGDLVDRLQDFDFSPPCYPNYGVLTLAPVGLSPTEHTSLLWLHNAACGFPALRSPACFMPRFMGPILLGQLSAAAVEPCSR